MYMQHRIIDAHCHIYPDKIAEKAALATADFYNTKTACYGTVGELLDLGEKVGIDHYIVQSVATTPDQVPKINSFIAKSVSESGGKMTGLGTLHPDSDDIEGDIENIIRLGLIGVKLHPDIQKFKIDDYRMLKIYELCEGRLPILMHTGDSRYDYSNPNRLIPILNIYSNLTVIGAHFGGYSMWCRATEELFDKNLYVDCSSAFTFLTDDEICSLISKYGSDRVLFGSDYPLENPYVEVKRFLSLPLNEEDKEKILFSNAKKLFNLDL